MKKNTPNYLLSCLIIFLIASCSNKPEVTNIDFGEIHPGQKIEKTIFIDFSNDAKKDKNTYLEVQYLTADGKIPSGVKYTYLGKTSPNSIIKIYAKDFIGVNYQKIGIQFPKGAAEQEINGTLNLINTSDGLVGSAFGKPIKKNGVITTWHVNKTDPLPLWMTVCIWLGSVLLLLAIIYFILSRNNMPFGSKTFKNGILTFPNGDANVSMVRLDNLKIYDLSMAYSELEIGKLILEPYDKLHNRKKLRFARLTNQSQTVDIKLFYDGKEEFAGAAQELYNNDEIIITNGEKKYTIRYANNNINRIY